MTGEVAGDNFPKVVSAFSLDHADSGRAPRSPVDIAGNIAAKVADKIDVPKLSK
jgi:hypothetical protein